MKPTRWALCITRTISATSSAHSTPGGVVSKGDVVRAVASIESVPMAKLTVKQAVYNQDGVLCAEGAVVLGFLNKETGRPTRCPQKLADLIAARLDEK